MYIIHMILYIQYTHVRAGDITVLYGGEALLVFLFMKSTLYCLYGLINISHQRENDNLMAAIAKIIHILYDFYFYLLFFFFFSCVLNPVNV